MLMEPIEELMAPREDEGSGSSDAVNLKVDVAVLKEKVGGIDRKLDDLRLQLSTNFVSKQELAAIVDDVKALKSNQSWILKIIVGAVLAGVLGLVIIKGGVH